MKARAIICGLGLLFTAPLGAADRLMVKVSPAVSFAPANLIVRAMVAADDENRAMEIVAESESFYRSSEIELDGGRAPRTTMFEFRSLPGGTYQVTATLFGSRGQALSSVRQEVNVLSTSGK